MIINLRFPINCHSRTGLIADPPTPLTTTDHSPHMSPTSPLPSHPLLLNPPLSHLCAYQYALPDAADASSFPSSLRVSPAQLLQLLPHISPFVKLAAVERSRQAGRLRLGLGITGCCRATFLPTTSQISILVAAAARKSRPQTLICFSCSARGRNTNTPRTCHPPLFLPFRPTGPRRGRREGWIMSYASDLRPRPLCLSSTL